MKAIPGSHKPTYVFYCSTGIGVNRGGCCGSSLGVCLIGMVLDEEVGITRKALAGAPLVLADRSLAVSLENETTSCL